VWEQGTVCKELVLVGRTKASPSHGLAICETRSWAGALEDM